MFWIILAFAEPSGLHTFNAIALTVLAAAQLASAYYARQQRRGRAQDTDGPPN